MADPGPEEQKGQEAPPKGGRQPLGTEGPSLGPDGQWQSDTPRAETHRGRDKGIYFNDLDRDKNYGQWNTNMIMGTSVIFLIKKGSPTRV